MGASWEGFGESYKLSGTILGPFFKDFLPSWAKCENSKKPKKTNGFSLIFGVLGGPWASENLQKSMKRRWQRLSEAKNEAKRGLGSLKERKMRQHDAQRVAQQASGTIGGGARPLLFRALASPKDHRSLKNRSKI